MVWYNVAIQVHFSRTRAQTIVVAYSAVDAAKAAAGGEARPTH